MSDEYDQDEHAATGMSLRSRLVSRAPDARAEPEEWLREQPLPRQVAAAVPAGSPWQDGRSAGGADGP